MIRTEMEQLQGRIFSKIWLPSCAQKTLHFTENQQETAVTSDKKVFKQPVTEMAQNR